MCGQRHRVRTRLARRLLAAVAALSALAGCSDPPSPEPTATAGAGAVPGSGAPSVSVGGSPSSSVSSLDDRQGRPRTLVAVSIDTALVVLDPITGIRLRTLVSSGVSGDAVALDLADAHVYFARTLDCRDQIWRVPIAGGVPSLLVDGGSLPAVSPDGSTLAYVLRDTSSSGCRTSAGDAATAGEVVIRDLPTGRERRYPMLPALAGSGFTAEVTHLSWRKDNQLLAVSTGEVQDHEGRRLTLLDPDTDHYYYSDVPGDGGPRIVPASGADYYTEGVFLPDGDLFVDRECCEGTSSSPGPGSPKAASGTSVNPGPRSVSLEEIDPTTGKLVRPIATGMTTRSHSSLSTDAGGDWLLYLSGDDLKIVHPGEKVATLASGFLAADW